jgi:hypothetical protein
VKRDKWIFQDERDTCYKKVIEFVDDPANGSNRLLIERIASKMLYAAYDEQLISLQFSFYSTIQLSIL